jgi:hypothetical protein
MKKNISNKMLTGFTVCCMLFVFGCNNSASLKVTDRFSNIDTDKTDVKLVTGFGNVQIKTKNDSSTKQLNDIRSLNLLESENNYLIDKAYVAGYKNNIVFVLFAMVEGGKRWLYLVESYSLDNLKKQWTTSIDCCVTDAPVINKNYIYIAGRVKFYKVDIEKGKIVWVYEDDKRNDKGIKIESIEEGNIILSSDYNKNIVLDDKTGKRMQ